MPADLTDFLLFSCVSAFTVGIVNSSTRFFHTRTVAWAR
jgi:hypothetical protein